MQFQNQIFYASKKILILVNWSHESSSNSDKHITNLQSLISTNPIPKQDSKTAWHN